MVRELNEMDQYEGLFVMCGQSISSWYYDYASLQILLEVPG